MKKTDTSIHKICIAAIGRSLMDAAELNFTQIYKDGVNTFPFGIGFNSSEISICSTIENDENWSILTTQRLISSIKNVLMFADIETADNRSYGDIKGCRDETLTLGLVVSPTGEEISYLVEVGMASMVMVNGIRARIAIQQNSEENNQTRLSRWERRGLL